MDADAWDARYAASSHEGQRVWSAGPNALIAEIVGGLAPGRAIDLGAGEGRHALWLAHQGWSVTAVDFSAIGLEVGRAEATRQGLDVEWVTADVTKWSPSTPVDLVLLAYLHVPRASTTQLLNRAAAWLSPGGRLVVVAHDAENLVRGVGGPQDPDLLPDTALLSAAVAPLVIERCEQVLRDVDSDEGPRQAIDVVLVARA